MVPTLLGQDFRTAMERWKIFFQSSGVDLWTVCERALTIAYNENPEDFPIRRDILAQRLFAPEKLDMQACERDAPMLAGIQSPSHDEANVIRRSDGQDLLKIDASSDLDQVPDRPYDEAEVLTEEMEEEILVKRAVLSIKETLLDLYQPEKEILDSLHRLDLMQLSVEVLQDTGIGVTVNSLRKHSSQRVRSASKQLVSGWKDLVDEWVRSAEDVTAAATTETPASNSPNSVNEDHGLPSPPMDEGALLAARTSPVEMSQLFDFMDDISAGSDGRSSPEDDHQHFLMHEVNGSCGNVHSPRDSHTRGKQSGYQSAEMGRSNKSEPERKEAKERGSPTGANGHNERKDHLFKNSSCDSNGRTNDIYVERKVHRESTDKRDTGNIPRTQTSKPISNSTNCNGNSEYGERLQASKRKLQENYQQADLVKKQRTIQVMDLQDLPKGGPNRAKSLNTVSCKPGSQHRPLGMGRK